MGQAWAPPRASPGQASEWPRPRDESEAHEVVLPLTPNPRAVLQPPGPGERSLAPDLAVSAGAWMQTILVTWELPRIAHKAGLKKKKDFIYS